MAEKTFKDYLDDGMFDNFIRTGVKLQKFLSDNGIDVTVRTAQRYIKGDYVPEFEQARKIMDAMKVDISDEELRRVVKESDATFRKKMKLEHTLTLKVRNLSDKYKTDEEILKALDERFHKSQDGQKPRFSSYIEELIKADIDRHILD